MLNHPIPCGSCLALADGFELGNAVRLVPVLAAVVEGNARVAIGHAQSPWAFTADGSIGSMPAQPCIGPSAPPRGGRAERELDQGTPRSRCNCPACVRGVAHALSDLVAEAARLELLLLVQQRVEPRRRHVGGGLLPSAAVAEAHEPDAQRNAQRWRWCTRWPARGATARPRL